MFMEILFCHQICLDVMCVGRVCPRGAGGARRGLVCSLPSCACCAFCAFCMRHRSAQSAEARKNEERLVSLGRWLSVACRDNSHPHNPPSTTRRRRVTRVVVPFPRGEWFLFLEGHRCFPAKNRRDANAPKREQGGGPAARP